MTASELKALHEEHNPESLFFDRKTMRFFGDTMKNYGVCIWENGLIELFRKRPVKHELQKSAFFDPKNYNRVFRPESYSA